MKFLDHTIIFIFNSLRNRHTVSVVATPIYSLTNSAKGGVGVIRGYAHSGKKFESLDGRFQLMPNTVVLCLLLSAVIL